MNFKEIYTVVDNLKELCVESLPKELDIELIYVETVPLTKDAMKIDRTIIIRNDLTDQQHHIVLLHEIGHILLDKNCYCSNHRTEENNANIFMCLYLIHNEIWDYEYFDEHLIYQGVNPKVARSFNEAVWQYKRQQVLQLAY